MQEPRLSCRLLLILSLIWVGDAVADDYLDFVMQPWQRVSNDYRLRPLTSNYAVLRRVMDVVNDICMTNAPVYIAATNDGTCFAHPGGVVLAAPYLESLYREFNGRDYERALMFILAHEHAHWRVLNAFPVRDVVGRDRVRGAEIQAHILALEVMLWWAIRQAKDRVSALDYASFDAEFYYRVASFMGKEFSDQGWNYRQSFPSSNQCTIAFQVGTIGGWRYFDTALARHRRRLKNHQGSTNVLNRTWMLTNDVPFVEALPWLKPYNLTYEGDLAWSMRTAGEIVRRGELAYPINVQRFNTLFTNRLSTHRGEMAELLPPGKRKRTVTDSNYQ